MKQFQCGPVILQNEGIADQAARGGAACLFSTSTMARLGGGSSP